MAINWRVCVYFYWISFEGCKEVSGERNCSFVHEVRSFPTIDYLINSACFMA